MRNRWLAGDGLPARPSGWWTQEKLGYVERYASAFMVAMHPKRREGKWEQLVYIDLLLFFPSAIGIRRNLRQFVAQEQSPMDAFWGGKDWRELPPARLAAGKRLSATEVDALDRPWVSRFREKMAGIGFRAQDEGDPCFCNEKNSPMYHLLFFSHHPAGLKIWRNIKKIEPTGQRSLPGV